MSRIVVLADTHLQAGRPRRLPDAVVAALAGADLVLHAGDLQDASALAALATHAPGAPLHAVRGNHDRTLGELPERVQLTVDGVRIAMVHDPGPVPGRARRLRRWFPDADLVVFGHTHRPVDDAGDAGQRLFNPGSPTERRRHPHRAFGIVEVGAGRVASATIVPLGT